MTKEELVAIGLDDEQMKEVFRLNGLAVEKAKGDLASKQEETERLEEQLEHANSEIEGFRELNVDEIRQKADDYKAKYEQAEKDAEARIANIEFEHQLDSILRDNKARNVKAVKALMDIEELRQSNEQTESIQGALESIKEENGFLFESEEKPQGTGGSMGAGERKKVRSVTKEDFSGMGYMEKLKLKRTDKELYDELKGDVDENGKD